MTLHLNHTLVTLQLFQTHKKMEINYPINHVKQCGITQGLTTEDASWNLLILIRKKNVLCHDSLNNILCEQTSHMYSEGMN